MDYRVPTAAQLLTGYAQGVFPMAHSAADPQLHWYDPPFRGILPVGGIHASRSLRRSLRRGGWTADASPDFDAIVDACAARSETWINAPLARLYADLHRAGHAHALAVYHQGQLAGGLFGVTLGGAFFGESMFSSQRDGSKMALLWLSQHLADCGFTLLDTQYLTPHLASMGGQQIPRASYQAQLRRALTRVADFRARPLSDAAALLRRLEGTGVQSG
ncbi:leucyl/phenylalanyl-tRNA--protein transferase [uncultured Paracoccus sp.]|uniref:leucyl/phenylalanyl-tRNA--protein transferase n=1 Tax=uncultured Paracoccus sp. TaxID=189685 RepID=UPI00260728E0|nr:leucyl/phenylalanyl-tRNA--protein transferase [uncultured Paracoccus sp.]